MYIIEQKPNENKVISQKVSVKKFSRIERVVSGCSYELLYHRDLEKMKKNENYFLTF